jgi:hypothetical protein
MTGASGAVSTRELTPAPQPAGFPPTDAVDPIPFGGKKKSPVGLILAVLGVLAVGGGAAAFVIFKKPPEVVKNDPPPPLPKPQPTVAPPPQAPALQLQGVIVDTTPQGAKILRDGVQIAETPEEVKVAVGSTVSVVLHKDGYIDEPVVVDPSKGHKLLVKLDKMHGTSSGGHHPPKAPVYTKLPAPPPVPTPTVAPAPTPTPTVSQPVKPKPHKNVDPYERLDDAPAPSKKADVLNPY